MQAIQRSYYKVDQNANHKNALYVSFSIHHRMSLIYLLVLFFFASFLSFANLFSFSNSFSIFLMMLLNFPVCFLQLSPIILFSFTFFFLLLTESIDHMSFTVVYLRLLDVDLHPLSHCYKRLGILSLLFDNCHSHLRLS